MAHQPSQSSQHTSLQVEPSSSSSLGLPPYHSDLQARMDVSVGTNERWFNVPIHLFSWLGRTFLQMLDNSGQVHEPLWIRLHSITDDTFVRLCEYAFTRKTYSVPAPTTTYAPHYNCIAPYYTGMHTTHIAKNPDRRTLLERQRMELHELCLQISPTDCLIPHVPYYNEWSWDFWEVFKAHADLFIAAQLLRFEPAQWAALDRLEAMFVTLRPYSTVLSNIVTLARYTYNKCLPVSPAEPCLRRTVMRTLVYLAEGYCGVWPELQLFFSTYPGALMEFENSSKSFDFLPDEED